MPSLGHNLPVATAASGTLVEDSRMVCRQEHGRHNITWVASATAIAALLLVRPLSGTALPALDACTGT